MSIAFNADEVFEMAEQIERNGASFYRKAAQNNPGGRGILLEIADEEDDHLDTFRNMRKELAGDAKEPTAFDPYGEAALYLKAMADGHVFDLKEAPESRLTGKERMSDIIEIAIGLEKDSIVFYLGLKDAVPEKLGREYVLDIIGEEMKHIRRLSDKLTEGGNA